MWSVSIYLFYLLSIKSSVSTSIHSKQLFINTMKSYIVILIVVLSTCFSQIYASPEFSCDFEDGTMCGMNLVTAPINFTIATGETIDNTTLGPLVDHTLNASSGHFLYWYRSAEMTRVRVDGLIDTPSFTLQPNMCLRFAYYINSISEPEKVTALGVTIIGCSQGLLWVQKTITSNGWQTVEHKLPHDSCAALISFFVSSNATTSVSVSLDDIQIDLCENSTTVPIVTTATTAAASAITTDTFENITVTILTSPVVTTHSFGTILHYSYFLLVFTTVVSFIISMIL